MSVQVEKLENNMAKLTIEVAAEEFVAATAKAYHKNKNQISVQGFRKGKAPQAIIEKLYGASIFYEDAANDLIPGAYEAAAKESGLDITSYPSIDVVQVEKGKPFIFTAEVALRPDVELGEYKGVEIEKVSAEVTEEDIEAEIKKVQEQNAREVTVDRPAENGDTVMIDYEGSVDGELFEGGSAEGYGLVLGSGSFIPGFEDQIVGMKAGEEKDVKVKFPDEYFSKDLAGKDATFKVKVNEIKKKELPELDDEFAKDVSEFDTLKELKASIKEKLEKENEERTKYETQDAAVKAVCDNTEIDIPSGMIDSEIDNMVNDMKSRLQYQGLNLEQYFQFTGTDAEKMREYMKENAETKVKTELVLEALQKAEKMEVLDEELKEKAKHILDVQLSDTLKAHRLLEDGTYQKVDRRGKEAIEAQKTFCEEAIAAANESKKKVPKKRTFDPRFSPQEE